MGLNMKNIHLVRGDLSLRMLEDDVILSNNVQEIALYVDELNELNCLIEQFNLLLTKEQE
jgi:exoribonuclease R